MRTRLFRGLAASVLLTFLLSSVPVMATSRDRDAAWLDRDFPFIGRVIAKIKKTLGVTTTADTLTVPTP